MRIAAIDIGSNSLHLVIAEAVRTGGFHVLDSEKDMIRLGAGTLVRGRLSPAAMRRGLEVLADYKRLADTHRVDKIVAVATSAIREAGNGEEFLERIGREVGIHPMAISGEEEARLVYLAALHSVHLEGRRALVVDIGGGSVELAVGTGGAVEAAFSEKIGVLRTTEAFVRSDPISARQERALEAHVQEAIRPIASKIRERRFEVAIGSSGTILALGALASEMETGRRPDALHHVSVRAETIRALRRRLCATGLAERLRMRGLDEARADIVVAGAVTLDAILKTLGVEEIVLSTWALREGILLQYIRKHPKSLARVEAYPDVRRRSVVELAERCEYDAPHARHVAALALALFDGARKLHGLEEADRTLLEHAALLHDIGHHISHEKHHRHSYYLIKNGDLRGFDPLEIDVLANVARYHRQGMPRKKHEAFAALPARARRSVRVLAGILRLADALDRSHRQIVRGVEVAGRKGRLRLVCATEGNADLELWGARRRVALLEACLGAKLVLEARPAAARPEEAAPPAPAPAAAGAAAAGAGSAP
jgi:exopolyphosphatase/guanosine-5'-triphosphate,3'-diphosphate pyrophosphatase